MLNIYDKVSFEVEGGGRGYGMIIGTDPTRSAFGPTVYRVRTPTGRVYLFIGDDLRREAK